MDGFNKLKDQLNGHQHSLHQFLEKAEAEARACGHDSLVNLIDKEKNRTIQSLQVLNDQSDRLHDHIQKTLESRTRLLEKQIESLKKTKDTLISDNLLLEYKKKDLLLLTTKLEEANEEISLKNKALILQQEQISEQANRLNAINEEILIKHQELERQKEALLDQSDYLHEANETITMMHEEVQKQKNEILKKNEELLNLNNEKNNLIGIVAHDLKSPLNQMKGLLSLVKMNSSSLDQETQACLDMMEKSAERLTDLIGKILDVEAIEANKLNLKLERFNLSELLVTIVEQFRRPASDKFIPIHTQIDTELFIFADRVYTGQIFENLISNAIKFSPNYKNIYIQLAASGHEVIGEVRDEGPGISESDQKKLFGKYQKLSARPTGNESSSGLGLSIVKKFVDAMDGRIWCESELDKGARFKVALPVNPQ